MICPLLELPLRFTINHMFFQCCWHRGITRMFFHPHLAAESPCDVQLCSSKVTLPQGCPVQWHLIQQQDEVWGFGPSGSQIIKKHLFPTPQLCSGERWCSYVSSPRATSITQSLPHCPLLGLDQGSGSGQMENH